MNDRHRDVARDPGLHGRLQDLAGQGAARRPHFGADFRAVTVQQMPPCDQVTWRYPWWRKFRHPRIYFRMRNAFKGIPALSDLLP
jgi:hypothetical protein